MSRVLSISVVTVCVTLLAAGPVRAQVGPELFVSCHHDSKVVRIDTSAVLAAVTNPFVPPGSGGLSQAIGGSFGPGGDLFVSSGKGNQVIRYDGMTGAFKPVVAAARRDTTFQRDVGPSRSRVLSD
jgi:hypothetical protein